MDPRLSIRLMEQFAGSDSLFWPKMRQGESILRSPCTLILLTGYPPAGGLAEERSPSALPLLLPKTQYSSIASCLLSEADQFTE